MIREYKKLDAVNAFGNYGFIYEAVKDNKKYFLYQFEKLKATEAYNFKVLHRIMSSHILAICEEFQEGGFKYVVTDYAEKDLLTLKNEQPNTVFTLPDALRYFVKLILAIEQFHENKLIYRNLRPELIKIRGDDLFFYDFRMSQFCKRKQRIFDLVGIQKFMAPEFFTQDGYGFEIDIWAAGVLLFFMLTNQYPFRFKDKSQKATLQQLKSSLQKGFSFEKRLQTCNNPGSLKSNDQLQDFFRRIFQFDYSKRITIPKIKKHRLLKEYFPQKIDPNMLQPIGEEESMLGSAFLSKIVDLCQYSIWNQIEKEQFILDFIEKCSQSLMLDCCECIPENVIAKAQFAILKMALIRINKLIEICYGIKKPVLNFDQKQFQIVKSSSSFKKTLSDIENKKKALQGLYRSAYVHLGVQSEDNFFNEAVPEDFNQIKVSYRLVLSQFFETAKNVLPKNKGNKPLIRKLTEVMARIVIMHLVNRIFLPEDFLKNFTFYLEWSKSSSIENLDNWIHAQKQVNLKHFIKETTKNYL